MANKINQMSIAAYTAVVSFFVCAKNDLKDDERGLSGVVVAVMLILVAILAVSLLWGILSGWLQTFWQERIVGATNDIQAVQPG